MISYYFFWKHISSRILYAGILTGEGDKKNISRDSLPKGWGITVTNQKISDFLSMFSIRIEFFRSENGIFLSFSSGNLRNSSGTVWQLEKDKLQSDR